MAHDYESDLPGLEALKQQRPPAPGDDRAFLAAVKDRVRFRRRRRIVAGSALSSVTAVLLLLAVLAGGPMLQNGVDITVLREMEMADSPITSDEELDAELAGLFGDSNRDNAETLTEDLALIFQAEDYSDPVDLLEQYDDDVQQQILDRLKSIDILATGGGES